MLASSLFFIPLSFVTSSHPNTIQERNNTKQPTTIHNKQQQTTTNYNNPQQITTNDIKQQTNNKPTTSK